MLEVLLSLLAWGNAIVLSWEYFYFYNYIFPPVYNKIPLNGYLYALMAGFLLAAIGLSIVLKKGL